MVGAGHRAGGRPGELPVTFVAVDAGGEALGAVGLGEFDIVKDYGELWNRLFLWRGGNGDGIRGTAESQEREQNRQP